MTATSAATDGAPSFAATGAGYLYSAALPPLGSVQPDQRFTVETLDCFTGRYTDPDGFTPDNAAWVDEHLNPVTGPIAVAGALAGQAIEVTVHDIELVGPALIVVSRCTAPSPQDWWGEEHRVVHGRIDGNMIIAGRLRVPARPLIGCLAVAPDRETIFSRHEADAFGGNVDVADIGIGATVTLPVNVDGALLFFGDCKAAIGQGEVVCAPEIGTRVTASARPVPRPPGMTVPRIRIGSRLITYASDISLADACRRAFAQLKLWLQDELDLSSDDAAILMGMAAHCGVGQVSNRLHTGTAAIDLDSFHLEGHVT